MFGKTANFQSNSWNASRIVEKVQVVMVVNKHLKILKEKAEEFAQLILEEKLDSSKSFTSYEDALVSNHSKSQKKVIKKKTPKERRIILKHAG